MDFRVCFIKSTTFTAVCMLSFLLTGCAGLTSVGGGSGNVTGDSAMLTGKAHGGFNAISGGTVDLYLAGTAGYGVSAATTTGGAQLVAHTATGSDGSFSFSKVAGAANDNSGSTYTCPASGDPLVYLVLRGGNTTGSGGSGSNSASVLLTLLGPCSTDTGSVTINEATTVGAIFALQQFMSVTTADIFIGAPSTTSAATGIKNAYSTFLNMIDPLHGTILTTFTPSSIVPGVTMTGTTESAKLITIANILAGCVNQVDNTTAPCTSLMTNAVAPTYQTTNQAVSSYVAATDTAVATYYLAVNPTQAQDGTARNVALYNLSTGYTPFGTGLGVAPADWTLAITYTAAGTCTISPSLKPHPFNLPRNLAIDSTGQVWVTNGSGTSNAVVGISPNGGMTTCLGGTIIYGWSILVDNNDHVWYTERGTLTSGTVTNAGLFEYTGSTTISWPLATGYQPYTVTTTKAGDIIMLGVGAGTYTPQIYANAAAVTDDADTFSAINGSSSPAATEPADLAVTYYPTNSTNPFFFAAAGSGLYGFAPTGAAAPAYPTTYATYGVATQRYASIGTDNNGLIAGASEAGGTSPYSTWFQATPVAGGSGTVTATTVLSSQFLGGINSASGFAVDGVNNYWASLQLPSIDAVTTGGITTPAVYGIAETRGTLTSGGGTPLSPSGSIAAPIGTNCTLTDCPAGGSFQRANVKGALYGTAIDPSGNVWATISAGTALAGNGLVEIVGAAAPVVTPLVKSVQ